MYSIVAKRGWTGRFGAVTVEDQAGHRRVFGRRELLEDGGHLDLASGEELRIRIDSELEEKLETLVDGEPTTFAPCKAMKEAEFARMVRRTGRLDLVQGVVGSLLSAALLVGAVSSLASPGRALVLGALGVAFAYGSLVAFRGGLDLSKRESSLSWLLRNAPAEIGWVYPKTTKRILVGATWMGGTEHSLVIVLKSGRHYEVRLSALQLEPALRLMSKRSPEAALGFSPDQRAKYERLARAKD